MSKNDWFYPTKIRFGSGRVSELPLACGALNMKTPLLVTDSSLVNNPIIADAIRNNNENGLPTGQFSNFVSNPRGEDVVAGVQAFYRQNCDGVIAFGGGSAIDVGKAIALMVGQKYPIWDFEDVGDNWQNVNVEGMVPVVAIPTTAGTGSETGRASVIIDETTQTKKVIFHPGMMPGEVILDPTLSIGLPSQTTAATGMDALVHCLEAYCVSSFHPMADGIALEGLRLIKEWLPKAFADGKNLSARGNMLVAASMGSTAFQKGLGAVHALSHPVSALYNTHHGLTNAVILPYVLAFNQSQIAAKAKNIARYLDIANGSFAGLLDWVLALRRDLSIPHTLSELRLSSDRIPEMAKMAVKDAAAPSNPVKLNVKNAEELFQAAFFGEV